MKTIYEMPTAAKEEVAKFANLSLGGKQVRAPYYINLRKQRGGLRVLVGKGSAEEIIREVKVLAQLKGFDLIKADESQIRQFMMDRGIGIDCSGFVFYVVNAWLRSQGDPTLSELVKFKSDSIWMKLKRRLRPAENIGANLLTGELNSEKINDLNQIRPGDFIRLKGRQKNAHHILLISRVVIENDVIKEFEYVHSHREYDLENGIRVGKVIVTDPKIELKDQNWTEIKDGKNWTYEDLVKDYEDNGVRRFKYADLKYITL